MASRNWPPDNFWPIAYDAERSNTPGTPSTWPPKRRRWRTDGAVNMSSQTPKRNEPHKKHQTNTQDPLQSTMDGTPSTDTGPDTEARHEGLEFAAREATEATAPRTGRTSARVPGHGHGFLALMALMLPSAAAAESASSSSTAGMRWPLMLVALGAAFLCGLWVARCRYLPQIASLERSVREAVSIRDQAVASMEVHHNRCYETQAANRELRGVQSLMQEELDHSSPT